MMMAMVVVYVVLVITWVIWDWAVQGVAEHALTELLYVMHSLLKMIKDVVVVG
jgi:hypothetical protein